MKKNKICLIMKNNEGWTGGSEYIKNILFSFSYLETNDRKKVELHLISFENKNFNKSLEKYYDYLHTYDNLSPLFIRKLFKQKSFNKLKEFIFTFLTVLRWKINFVFPFPNYLSFLGINSALWIPDFQHHYLDKFFSNKEIQYRNKKFKKIVRNSSLLVLSSKDSRKDLNKFYQKENKKVFVLNFRANLNRLWLKENPEQTIKKYHLPDKFFLISNQFWKHKNHLLVFKALDYLKNKKNIKPIIVFTGKLFYGDDSYGKEIIAEIKKLNINNQIFILGLIPKKDQFLLMRKSIAIIQPSLFEGWSTIVEESRSIGKNIILSDLGVHKEQNFSRSIFFQRNSYEDLALKISYAFEKFRPGPNKNEENLFARKHKILMQNFAKRFLLLSNIK